MNSIKNIEKSKENQYVISNHCKTLEKPTFPLEIIAKPEENIHIQCKSLQNLRKTYSLYNIIHIINISGERERARERADSGLCTCTFSLCFFLWFGFGWGLVWAWFKPGSGLVWAWLGPGLNLGLGLV